MDYKFRNMYCFNNAIRHYLKLDNLYFPKIEFKSDEELRKKVDWSTPFPIYIKKDYDTEDFRKLKMPNILNFKVCYEYYSQMDNFFDISKINNHSRMKVNYDTGTFKEKSYENDVDKDLSILCIKDFLLKMDIKSFYDGIYLHNINKADTILGTLNDGCTNGLILGNYLSLFLAENYLTNIAKKLDTAFETQKIDCSFSYFSDDFFFFVKSKDVKKVEEIFSEILSEIDLHVNSSKTLKLNYLEYNNDNVLNRYWNKIVNNQNAHIFDWYNTCLSRKVEVKNIRYLYTVFNQLIYRCYQLSNNKKQNVLVNSFFKSRFWNDELSGYKFSLSNTDVHQIVYLIKEYPECGLYLIPKLDLSFEKIRDKILSSVYQLFSSSLESKFFERQLYYIYILLKLDSNQKLDDLYDRILMSNNQVLISMLLVYNESFLKWFTRKGIKTRLVDNQNFWFANYHVILTYYKKGLTSEKMLSKYICMYLIPLKYHDEAKKLMIEFYYQNIVAKNPFVASICEISDSITEYLLQRNHVKNDDVVDENEQDYQEIIDFDF